MISLILSAKCYQQYVKCFIELFSYISFFSVLCWQAVPPYTNFFPVSFYQSFLQAFSVYDIVLGCDLNVMFLLFLVAVMQKVK